VPGRYFNFEGQGHTHEQIFFAFYFGMTGLHAFHMIVGIGLLTWLIVLTARGRVHPKQHTGRGDDRPVLALRRHRLDLPVPAAVSPGRHAVHVT
jgi:hypothetical protein